MNKYNKTILLVIFVSVTATKCGLINVKTGVANCNLKADQAQNVKCGVNAPVTINVTGGGTTVLNATNCVVSAKMTLGQQAGCQGIAGKTGDIVTFADNELPHVAGKDKFILGSITTVKPVNGIAAPTDGNSVLLSFVTAEGLPINFLIKRNTFTKENLNALDTETDAGKSYKAKLAAQFPANGSMVATWYYRQLPGLDEKWTELWTDLDSPTSYPFAPTFNARVYPNGLVVLNKNIGHDSQTKQLFFIGDYQLKLSDEALGVPKGVTPTQIPIGGGKFVSPKDV